MILNERESRHEHVLHVARQMTVSYTHLTLPTTSRV